MKYVVPFAVLLGAAGALPASAQTVHSAGSNVNPRAYDRVELQQMYAYRLKALRAEALKQQVVDGGTLSAASLNRLQAKLDGINATRERNARRSDLMSVDAFGANVRPKG